MIDYVSGNIQNINDLCITVMIQGVGLTIYSPHRSQYNINQHISLYCYMHWNSESGPSLYGFISDLERKVFLLIIEVPKIGPKIGLTLLSSLNADQVLESIHTENEKILSSVSGIGPKKANQIVMHLKNKVAKLISSGAIKVSEKKSFAHWQNLTQALTSLGYTSSEISKTLQTLKKKSAQEEVSFDTLLRSALACLAKEL